MFKWTEVVHIADVANGDRIRAKEMSCSKSILRISPYSIRLITNNIRPDSIVSIITPL